MERRAKREELMDDFSVGGAELEEALKHLRRLNRMFGAAMPVEYGVNRLWEQSGKPASLSILDIGAGSGEINRSLLRWADKKQIELAITLVDATEEACLEANRLFANEPRVTIMQANLFDLPSEAADIVTGSQFAHHFSDEELPNAVAHMLKVSRKGAVLADIHRHFIAWLAVWLSVRMISKNRYILHDGPLSVAKGFRAQDWRMLGSRLQKVVGQAELKYSWRPLFRYSAVVKK